MFLEVPVANSVADVGFDLPADLHLLDGDAKVIAARVRRVNTGFFQLHCPIRLSEDQRVKVVYEGRAIEGEVVYCQKLGAGGYNLGVRMTSGHLGTIRKELRLPVKVRATVGLPGSNTPIHAIVVDMSQSGLGLLLSKPVSTGISALVDLGHGIAFGEIRYCQPVSRRRFRAGFLVEEFLYRAPAKRAAKYKNRFSAVARCFAFLRSLAIGRTSRVSEQ